MKKDIEQHIKNAFQELSPNREEEIWNRPVEYDCFIIGCSLFSTLHRHLSL